ncbi:MAG: hypothetical protein WAN12_07955 [Candidatus Acidiferrum sp.]
MRMDVTQRGWAWLSLGIFLLSVGVYAFYAMNAPAGPRGGSGIGLAFGIVGFAFMIFAALLGARQRVLMWLLIITVASGLFGAVLQHYVPWLMTIDVPLETVYDEIGNVRRLLREEADHAVEGLCGSLGFARRDTAEELLAGGFTALRPIAAAAVPLRTSAAVSAGASAAAAAAPEVMRLNAEQSAPLTRFYLQEMRVFLEEPERRELRLVDAEKAKSAFAALQTLLPATAQDTLKELEEICDEARQLLRQERLHRWLHGWLLVHIPLSLALILLGAVHAVVALRY